MIPAVTMRRLGPWLVTLFVMGQVFGVVSLLVCHTAHAAEQHVASSQHGGGDHASHSTHHHRGDGAGGCCDHHGFQDLGGPLVRAAESCEIIFAEFVLSVGPPRVLAATDPVRLDRPPKSVLSV